MDQEPKPTKRVFSRLGMIISIGLVVVLVVALFGSRIRQRLAEELVLRSETLNESTFHDLVDASFDRFAFINKAWASGKIPHRYAVSQGLKGDTALQHDLPQAEDIIIAGARDGDAAVRELSLAALESMKHSQLPRLLAEQIRDPDPNLRLLALDYLRSQPTNISLSLIAFALDDTDLSVAASAGVGLQRLASQDFGIRLVDVMRDNLDGEARKQFEDKRAEAKKWCIASKIKQPELQIAPLPGPFFTVADFTLQDLEGKTVRLSEFRGKTVLLNFWTTWCTACQSEFAILNELQKRHPNDLVILGISLDGVPDEHGHIPGRDDAGNDRAPTRAQIQKDVSRVAKARDIRYQVLLDPRNSVGGRFNGGELPTNVLIDKRGRFARRFIGARKIEALEAMIPEGR